MGSLDVPLPADQLPACWGDDRRMNALFAPCKHQSIAPEAWRQKMTFWSEALRSWCRHRRSPLVSVAGARSAFARNKNRPACLDVVLDEHVRCGEYAPARTYTAALGGGEGWVRWGARLALRPAALAASLVVGALPRGTPRDGMAVASIDHEELFANRVVLKELAAEVLRSWPANAERVGRLEELMVDAGYTEGERQTFEVLLGYMLMEKLAVKKGELYKLAEQSGADARPVSEYDEALQRLRAAERRLAADADVWRREEGRTRDAARTLLRAGDRTQARAELRRARRCGERADVSDAALDNVHAMLHRLRQAEVNSAIVDTYKLSSDAMKRVLKDAQLDEDKAHDTMDELREVLESYGEVERALAGGAGEGAPDDELEAELAALMADGGGGGAGGVDKGKGAPEKEFVYDGEERMMAELNELSSLGQRGEAAAAAGHTGKGRQRVAVAEPAAEPAAAKSPKPASKKPETPKQKSFPTSEKSPSDTKPTADESLPWVLKNIDNLDSSRAEYSLDALSSSMGELRTDPRLHPGQKLNPDCSRSARVMYNTDFQVQDHKLNDGVWIFNADGPAGDENRPAASPEPSARKNNYKRRVDSETDFTNSTAYPGDAESDATEAAYSGERAFQMAPGGERHGRSQPWAWQDEDTGVEDLERRLKNLRSSK